MELNKSYFYDYSVRVDMEIKVNHLKHLGKIYKEGFRVEAVSLFKDLYPFLGIKDCSDILQNFKLESGNNR